MTTFLRFSSLVVVLACFASMRAGQLSDDAKKPLTPQEVKRADDLISELYKDEIAKAMKDATAASRLAGQFLLEAKDTADDRVGRIGLINQAYSLANQAGDVALALQALDERNREFGVSAQSHGAIQQKVGLLESLSKGPGSPESLQLAIETALVLLEDATMADDFPSSVRLLALAEEAGRKLKSVALVSGLRRRLDEVKRAEKVYAEYEPFAKRLALNPKDSEAATKLGLYQALVKGNFEAGLPLLAQGTDGPLKDLAKKDLDAQRSGDAVASVGLGTGWSETASRFEGAPRYQALLRVYHWWQIAASTTSDVALRAKVQEEMNALMEALPADYRVGEIAAEWKHCEGHRGPVYAAAFAPDGKKAASVGADGNLHIWDVKTGKEQRRLDGSGGRLWSVAFAGDGRRVVTGGFDGGVRLWDLLSGRELRSLGRHTDYVRSVSFSRDGRLVVSAGDDRLVRLWNVDAGQEIKTFPGHDHFVWSAVLSPDSKRILSGSLDKTARLWDVETGKPIHTLAGHKDTVLAVAISPDGRRGLTGSTDRTVKLWNLETGQELATLEGHQGYVQSVAFSPDGRRALSAGQDKTVRLWDLTTGKQLRVLDGHREQVWSVAFARDGRWAISAGQEGVVRIWGGSR